MGFVTSVSEMILSPFVRAVYHPLNVYPVLVGSAGRVEYFSPNAAFILDSPEARVPPLRSKVTLTDFAVRINFTALSSVIFESSKIPFDDSTSTPLIEYLSNE